MIHLVMLVTVHRPQQVLDKPVRVSVLCYHLHMILDCFQNPGRMIEVGQH